LIQGLLHRWRIITIATGIGGGPCPRRSSCSRIIVGRRRRRPLRRRFVVGRRIRRVDDDDDPPTMALVLLGGLPGFEYGRVAFVALALSPLPFILDMVVVVACSRSCFFLSVVMILS
jgi:hypothetical protein